MSERTSVESANLDRVEEALSVCLNQGRRLTPGLVLDLHRMLMEGVPVEPGRPTKPGRFMDATDDVRAKGVEHLTQHMSPPWRVRSDMVSLLDETEEGRLHDDLLLTAAALHYRLVRIHPFCDGNGRMARALALLLLAKQDREVLSFAKPVNAVLLDHREDYIGVLEYCDSIYQDLDGEDVSEEAKLVCAEAPFCSFYLRAYITAYEEHNDRLYEQLLARGVKLERVARSSEFSDLSLQAIKARNPWSETVKRSVLEGRGNGFVG